MVIGKKSFYLQQLKDQICLLRLASLVLFFFLLIPSQPFQGEADFRMEIDGDSTEGKDDEIIKIYSVVRSNMAEWDEASVWAITRTILEESKRHSIDSMLVLAIIDVESRFQNGVVSSQGARGLMQILPFVANALAEEIRLRDQGIKGKRLNDNGSVGTALIKEDSSFNPSTLQPLDLDDPILNIKLGVFYLNHLKESFRDLKLALAAYNWGPTEVRNRLEDNEPVPLEYTMKVLSAYHNYSKGNRQAD